MRPAGQVTDEQVRAQIEQLLEQRAALAPVADRPMPGDLVRVSLATGEDDETFLEGREYPLELGAGQAIPTIRGRHHGSTTGRDDRALRPLA